MFWEISGDFDYLHLCINYPDKYNKDGSSFINKFSIAKHQEVELQKSINLHGYRHLLECKSEFTESLENDSIPL